MSTPETLSKLKNSGHLTLFARRNQISKKGKQRFSLLLLMVMTMSDKNGHFYRVHFAFLWPVVNVLFLINRDTNGQNQDDSLMNT